MGDPASGRLDVGTQDFSIEAWLFGTSSKENVVASKRPSGGSSPYWRVTVTDDDGHDGQVKATVFDGVVGFSAYGPAVVVDNGAWHHVVVVCDRDSGITIWVDGVSRTTNGAFPRTMSNTGRFIVGKSPNEGGFKSYDGLVDEFAFYTHTLSSTRVAAHHNAGRGIGLGLGG